MLPSLQLVSGACGLLLVGWALLSSKLRDSEGLLRGETCLLVALGGALLILSWAVAGPLRRSALWFTLAMVGQAVALQMIDAGPEMRYQHYKPLGRLVTGIGPSNIVGPLLLIYLVLQTGLVVWGLSVHWPRIRTWTDLKLKRWQLLGVALVFFLPSAAASREIPRYVAELVFAAFVQALNLANIVLVVWAVPQEMLASLEQRMAKLFGWGDVETGRGVDRFVLLAAVWVTVVAALLSVFVYERHPHVPDEVIYLYHARYLADGALDLPAPPVPEAFSFYLIPHRAERWYSLFPPGWPAVLAMGVLVGVPWLVNPVLAGLNLLLVCPLIGEIYDRPTARMVVLLLCLSPWYVFMGMNFMAHTFTLTCTLAAALGVMRARRTQKIRWALLAGLAIGMVSLIRPLDGLIVAGLLGVWAIGPGASAGIPGRRLRVPALAALVVGAIAVGAMVLPYNQRVTGDATRFPLMGYYEEYFGSKTNALGFGPERGLGWAIDPFPGHSPLEALLNANLNAFSVNVELFGWSTGSLILVALTVFSGRMRGSDYLLLSVVVVVLGVYSLYWFSGGPDFGARYWYLMIVPLTALTARGMGFLRETLGCESGGSEGRSLSTVKGTRIVVAVLALSGLALVNYFPWRAVDKYYHYLGMRPDIRHLAKERDFGESLVLVQGSRVPDYASAWVYNPLTPYDDAPVYAWDRDAQVRAQLVAAYPGRPVWIVRGPAFTHGAFEVVDGPLAAHELAVTEDQP